MPETETTLTAYAEKHGITADVEYAADNPNMDDMPPGSTHYLVTIKRDGADDLKVPFSQGPAITREPSLEDVLDCLASDASTVENARSFDDWANELGYFPLESSEAFRKAERTYKAVMGQTDRLRDFLPTSEAFEELLYNTERL